MSKVKSKDRKELEKSMTKAFNSLLNSQPEYSGHKAPDLASKMKRIVMTGDKK
jgi:hypothetical protein